MPIHLNQLIISLRCPACGWAAEEMRRWPWWRAFFRFGSSRKPYSGTGKACPRCGKAVEAREVPVKF
jgi:predicted RNA-binding Zn-ribbon protein involved in translation (DUF1610 family)